MSAKARLKASERALVTAGRYAVNGGEEVWNFGFGANINPWCLTSMNSSIIVEKLTTGISYTGN